MGEGSDSSLSIRELTRKITDLETQICAHKTEKQAFTDETTQLKFQLSVLRDQLLDTEELIRRTNQLEKEKSKELSLFKRDHEALKHRCQILEKQIEYRDDKLKELGVFINLSGNFETVAEKDAQSQQDALNTSVDSTASRDDIVHRLQSEIKSLKLDLQIEKTRNQNSESNQVAMGKGSATSASSDKSSLGQSSSSLSGNLQVKMKELEFKNNQLEKDKEFLQNNLTIAEKARDREKSRSSELETSEEKLKSELKTVKKDLKKLQLDYTDLETTNSSLRKKLEKQTKKGLVN
ncbi:uncharacterized protein LOC142339351 [Convolutriloba macropyga]|uniref:uncharacterized protein LOC142339351 n=1 Tax=Convolutriloba macropyga TaxID=536237 RepID=UPI003F51D642